MCTPKTMLKIGAIIVAVLVVGWFAFPQVRATLGAFAPFALVLICPLAMLLGGHGQHRAAHGGAHVDDDCCAGAAKRPSLKSSSRSEAAHS